MLRVCLTRVCEGLLAYQELCRRARPSRSGSWAGRSVIRVMAGALCATESVDPDTARAGGPPPL